ncbi:MAG: efflux RND transporter periplasmic adaptor subunit [Bacteroidota bacterium]|nr:efflux RND transporter periplasmic adaptor subunit [Bacteroidota bacterium]
MRRKIFITGGIGIAIIIIALIFFKSCQQKAQNLTFETVKVTKGNINNTVTATGTIQAIKTVAVGTQVSGVIVKLHADYNDHVKKNQLLAELDKSPLLMNMENAKAAMENANAEVTYQTSNYKRIKALFDKKMVAQSDYDLALYNYSKAEATLRTAKSEYKKAEINLSYATIYSPIDGIVLSRAVDEGQTVAASFNTPTLFSIANDLTQMQVEANIDEADIGKIKLKQRVDFTVDAFPDLKFEGEVTEIRLQPTTKSNVVTYTVIVKAPNPDFKLMPGMTANITIIVDQADNVLTIPLKALSFKPDKTMLDNYLKSLQEKPGPMENQKAYGKAPEPPLNDQNSNDKSSGPKIDNNNLRNEVWIKNGKDIHPAKVNSGIDDGINIQIISGLKEGDEIITSMSSSIKAEANKDKATSSPFMPKPPQRKNK